jgi:hypothetical protein
MLYIIGLPPTLANEQVLIANMQLLRRAEYCGQYGTISRVLIKDGSSNTYGSYSAYLTYESEEEASLAMLVSIRFI